MLEAAIRRGTLLTVAVLIVCVIGIAAAFRIPVQMIPDLDVRTISVVTGWSGATPQDVEKEILIEQERYLRTLPTLQRMRSYAETGDARIELEFPFGTDITETMIRVSNALSQVPSYPENVDQPRIYSSSFSENAFMYFRLGPVSGNPLALDMDMVRDFVEDYVRPRMERIPGVSQIDVRGGAQRQVQIRVDPERLALRGLSLSDVRDAIRARNRDVSAGDIDADKRRYLLRTVGRFDSVDALNELIIGHRNGANIRLGDVATVQLDHFEVRRLSYSNGERRITLAVRREAGSNVIDIKRAMLPVVDDINRDLLEPNGMTMALFTDDVRYVQESIANVWTNLGIGAVLASLVMLLFLRSSRATLVGVIGIPICTIAAFLGLLAFGRTINVISLAGVAFAIGMTVDNTIVVLESIEQARRRGLDRFEAALSGVRDVWPAVLASTLTTILVFAPVLFVQEEAGQLYSDIAIAISASILASMLVAILVVPTASAHIGFGATSGAAQTPTPPGRLLKGIDALIATPRRRLACVCLSVGGILGAAWLLTPAAEYLPEGEEPKAFTSMIAPPGYNLGEMQRIAEPIQSELNKAVDADPALFERGEARVPSLKFFSMNVGAGNLRVIAEPTRAADINPMMEALTTWFRGIPGMRAFSARGSIISSNDGGTRAVSLDISGADLGSLYATTQAAYRHAERLFDAPQISSEPSSLSLDQPLIEIRPRWERLAEAGMTVSDFGYAVSALSDGAYVDEFILDDSKIDIFLFGSAGNTQDLDRLGQLPLTTPSGAVLPLAALADLQLSVDSETLRRIDGRRTVTLYIVPPREIALETAVERVRNELVPALRASGEAGSDISIDISGAADQLDATQASLSDNFIIAIVLIYLLLVAIFTHWGYPLLILATVPLGLAGGIIGLALLNGGGAVLGALGGPQIRQPFDMITMLGFLILLGTVVNNPILIVDRTRQNLARGMASVVEAVRDAVSSRLRPILMSTATTVFGLAPLVLIPGAGTELYRGVGVVVLTGLLCSTVVTLTVLPCLLISLLTRLRRAATPK